MINKKTTIIIAVVVLAIIATFAYFFFVKKTEIKTPSNLYVDTNPLNQPKINPASVSNPYSNVKTNPFE